MKSETVEARVMEIIATKSGSDVVIDAPLGALALDSLAMADAIHEIEKAFSIRTDDRILEVESVQELASYVEELTNATHD